MFYLKYSKSSKRWINEHLNDIYVKKSYKNKKRSRAWFKLDEINKRNNIFKPGMNVLELGSAPGSWSIYVIKKIGSNGFLISCDKLFMLPIKGVKFIQGNIQNSVILKKILSLKKIDVVISDMSPNISGIDFLDMFKMIRLLKISFLISLKVLFKGGFFIVKVYECTELKKYLKKIHFFFKNVIIYKPKSSRARSREVYIIAIGKKFYFPKVI